MNNSIQIGFIKRAMEYGIPLKQANEVFEKLSSFGFGDTDATNQAIINQTMEMARERARRDFLLNQQLDAHFQNILGGAIGGAGAGGLLGAGIGIQTAPKNEKGERQKVGRRALLGALLGMPLGAVTGGGLGMAMNEPIQLKPM